MRNFHKPDDEKRSVVVLPEDAWQDWMSATSDGQIRGFLNEFDPAAMVGMPEPIQRKSSGTLI